MNYRPEIDGIRTLAIVPVLIYHLKIPLGEGYLLPGGFLGVDIFLVISGFLITKIILGEMQTSGTFSVKRFYERRARRILPALIMVILASMVAGLFLLTPTELNRLNMSALAALGFVSNAYWFVVLGEYGAQSGLLQPLLHTWSLAIEEQFYVVFPLLLLLLKPMRRPVGTLVVICACLLLSLGAAEVTTLMRKQLSFFSPVSRAWELLAGSVLAVLAVHFPGRLQAGPRLSRVVPVIGLGVIIACMVVIDLASWRHPGLVTVPVVLATAGIIWCAHPGELVTRLLSTAPFVFVGRISYSLYLWHFPIFAFGRLSSVENPGPIDMTLWVILTFACSVAGFYLVEKPFRFAASGRAFVMSLCASLTCMGAFVFVSLQTDLLKSTRSTDLAALYGGDFYDNEKLRDESWSVLDRLAGDAEEIGPWNAHEPSENERNEHWFSDDDRPKILVIGNSHSKDMFNALHYSPQNGTDFEVARFGMASRLPKEQRVQLFSSPNFEKADIIMIASRYPKDVEAFLPGFISETQDRGKTVVIAGNTPEFISPGAVPIYDWYIQRQRNGQNLEQMNHIAYGSRPAVVSEKNALLRRIANQTGSLYLARSALVCSETDKSCTLTTPQGQKTMYDYGHWTLQGAQYFGAISQRIGWLDPVLKAE